MQPQGSLLSRAGSGLDEPLLCNPDLFLSDVLEPFDPWEMGAFLVGAAGFLELHTWTSRPFRFRAGV